VHVFSLWLIVKGVSIQVQPVPQISRTIARWHEALNLIAAGPPVFQYLHQQALTGLTQIEQKAHDL
jgi:hypothetical protein